MFGWQRCSYPRWENPRSAFKARTGSEVRQELVWMINNKQSEWQHTIRVSNTLKAYSCWVDPGLGAYLLFTGVTIQNWVNMEEGGAEREHLSSKPPSDQSSALCVHIHLLPALCTTRHSGVSGPNKGFPTVDDVHTFNNKGTNNSIFLLSVFKAPPALRMQIQTKGALTGKQAREDAQRSLRGDRWSFKVRERHCPDAAPHRMMHLCHSLKEGPWQWLLLHAVFHVQPFLFTPLPCWSRRHGSPQSSTIWCASTARYARILSHGSKAGEEFIKRNYSKKKEEDQDIRDGALNKLDAYPILVERTDKGEERRNIGGEYLGFEKGVSVSSFLSHLQNYSWV